jgi:regulator of sigma E protease
LKAGDRILAVNGVRVNFFHEFEAEKLKTKNKATKLTIQRDAKELNLTVVPDENGAIGFYPESLLNVSRIEFSVLESVTKGTEMAFGSVANNIKGFGKLFRGEVSTKSLSGPIGIATMFPQTWDWRFFWTITGVLSMWLAFVNMLPIPVLDGGHVLFILMEIISGRRLPDKFLITTQMIGFILIITLMAFIIGNDLFNLIF